MRSCNETHPGSFLRLRSCALKTGDFEYGGCVFSARHPTQPRILVPAPGETQDSSCLASKTQCRKKKQGVIADRLIEGAQELWGKWTLNVLKYQRPDGARSA
jgi:hypothetical protein